LYLTNFSFIIWGTEINKI